MVHLLSLLLHSPALASTFEGCEVQRFGSEDVVKCEGALTALAGEKPIEGGTLVVTCAFHGPVAKGACATLLTAFPKE
jgi:hypothetical protein